MKIGWETIARRDLDEVDVPMDTNNTNNTVNSINLYILGHRFGIGDEGVPRNPVLACKLYEAATNVQTPIPGGHLTVMLHLTLHYERGIGVSNGHVDHEKAFALYQAVVEQSLSQQGLGWSRTLLGIIGQVYCLQRKQRQNHLGNW